MNKNNPIIKLALEINWLLLQNSLENDLGGKKFVAYFITSLHDGMSQMGLRHCSRHKVMKLCFTFKHFKLIQISS